MKIYCSVAVLVFMLCLVGCGNKSRSEAETATATAAHSFDQAPEALKDVYQKVVYATKSNDFAAATAAIDQLSKAQLSPEQEQAVADRKNELMIKLAKAAQNGDANAGKMLVDLRFQDRERSR